MSNSCSLPLLLALTVLFSTQGICQVRHPAGVKPVPAEMYSATDIVFSLRSKQVENPFNITFGAVFTGPDKKKLSIHGFFNGNEEYIIRFSPTIAGEWKYETFSSMPQLSGLKGSILVTNNANPTIHGAVAIDPNTPNKFIHQDGTPYFALAFELDWLFALDFGNPAAMPKTTRIIDEIKANGFNQVVMNVYAYDVNWKVDGNVPPEYNFKKPAYSPFKGNNQEPDFTGLNIDFFNHFDRVIDLLHKKGVVAHIMIYVWNKNVNWPPMYSEGDNRYFDYVIKRYQGYPNIMWDISKEALDYGRCDISYINERIQRIREQDAYKRLITVHDYEYCSREAGKVDFISIQNWRSDLYSLSLEAYLRHSDKPVMNIEHGGYEEGPFQTFEGNYTSPETCLIRNYQCVFAGVYSCYYWQNTSWNVVIYDPMNPGHTFKKPRFDYYKHLQGLFTRYDFNTLSPAKPKLTTNSLIGTNNFASSCYPLTNGRNLYMFLVPAENHQVNLVLPKPEEGLLEATWFNPFTGEYIESGIAKWTGWVGYKSPWEKTWSVLIIKTN